jgi:hypothetical protein
MISQRCLIVALLCAPQIWADSRFQVREMNRGDVPRGKGQCDIRVRVDNEAEISLRGLNVEVRNQAGREPRDDGSECNIPFRGRDAIRSFRFEKRDGRGSMRVVEEPSRNNGNRLVVAIRDGDGGEGRYHFRISWDADDDNFSGGGNDGGGRPGYDRPDYPGYNSNNSGEWNLNSREFDATYSGDGKFYVANTPDRDLNEVRVQLMRGGEAYVEFRGRGNVSFNGRWSKRGAERVTVTIRQFVQTEADGRMEIDFRRGRVDRITADGTTGRRGNRFQLNFTAR